MNNESVSPSKEAKQTEEPQEPTTRLKSVSELEEEITTRLVDKFSDKFTETHAANITKIVMQNIQRHFLVDDTLRPPKQPQEEPETNEDLLDREVKKTLAEFGIKNRK